MRQISLVVDVVKFEQNGATEIACSLHAKELRYDVRMRSAVSAGGHCPRRSERLRRLSIKESRVDVQQRLDRKRCLTRWATVAVHVSVHRHPLTLEAFRNRVNGPAAVERLPNQSGALAEILACRLSLKQHTAQYVSNLIRMQQNTFRCGAISEIVRR